MNVEAVCTPHPDDPGSYLLFVELAADAETPAQRPAVHLALALDASSSMGGPRLACAVGAARAVAERLGPEDLFCLLAFDREVRVLFGPGRVDAPAREAIGAALAALTPGVGTALHEALSRSYDALRLVFVRGSRPRALVLTDGYPSVGPHRPEAFAELSRRAGAEGIATSAVGVGLDFDEEAVAAIATGGGGRYSFVDQESDIPGALSRHLSDLFALALENAVVRVVPGNSVREAALLHRYPTRVGPDGFVVETGPVGRGSPRRLLFQLKASAPPAPVAATLAISARAPGAASEDSRILAVPVDPGLPAAAEAVRELYRLRLSGCEADFWNAIHDDARPAAQRAHEAALEAHAALERAGAPAAELARDRARLQDAKAVLEGRLSVQARELARRRSHETTISRVTSVPSDPD